MRRSLVTAVLVLAATRVEASPLQMFGFGGRSPALAATGVAVADDFDCVYLNPAGLGELARKRLSVGALTGAFDLRGVPRTVDDALGVEIGAALPIPLGGVLRDRLGLGLGIYIPARTLNRARAPMSGTPYYALLESRAEVVGVQAGVGARVTRTVSAGASFLALAELRGVVDVATDAGGRVTTFSEEQLVSHFAPILGVRWRPRSATTLGATLRFPSRSAYDIQVTNDLSAVVPIALPELRIAGVAQYDPLTVAVEAGIRPTRSWLLVAQLAWERWSAFPLPTQNPVPRAKDSDPPGFHDTVVPRLGVEWGVALGGLAATVRGGYFFAWSPAPEMTGAQALLDNDRHVVSVGLGLAAPRAEVPFHLDVWAQAHALAPRHHDRPAGEADLDTSGAIYVGGVVFGVDL